MSESDDQSNADFTVKNNLLIWDQICTTNSDHTKKFSMGGGDTGTAINTGAVLYAATRAFGPVGIGWGYEIVEERRDKGEPIFEFNDQVGSQIKLGHKITHTIRLKLWAMIDGEKAEVEHFGHTPCVYRSNAGKWITDQEAPKKSLTDALKKCLSMFGMNADIYMGLYDDTEYVNHRKRQEQIEKVNVKADEVEAESEIYRAWQNRTLTRISDSVSLNELQGLFVAAVKKAKINNDDPYIKKLTKAKDKRKGELDEAA